MWNGVTDNWYSAPDKSLKSLIKQEEKERGNHSFRNLNDLFSVIIRRLSAKSAECTYMWNGEHISNRFCTLPYKDIYKIHISDYPHVSMYKPINDIR
jgi:hypothetical protein